MRTQSVNAGRTRALAGWAVKALVALGFVYHAIMKLSGNPIMLANLSKANLGGYTVGIGLLQLVITALYLWPRTSRLGTLLSTGYWAAAFVVHLQGGEWHTPVIVLGLLTWLGQWLHDPALFRPANASQSA